MIDGYPRALTVAAVVGAGLVAGVFFAFSAFVMPALRQLPDAQGLRAMQQINRAAPSSPLFMAALFGTALLCVGLGISALTRLGEQNAWYQLVGCLLYLAGVVVTAVYHIPTNDALAQLDSSRTDVGAAWHQHVTGWVVWNHVRTALAVAACLSLALALRPK
jgi:uncharacterized membrane protein